MGISIWKPTRKSLLNTTCALLAVGLAYAVATPTQIPAGKKTKVQGSITARNGDLVTVKEKKSGDVYIVNLTDNTKIERNKSKVPWPRHQSMDVTAMLPGLTITAEGVGNAKGQLDAVKITFTPDEFAIEISQEQQIMANQAAANRAQNTANVGVAKANAAQSSANTAQSSANTAQSSAATAQSSADTAQSSADKAARNAKVAEVAAAMNAESLGQLNQRVSDLGDYKTVALAGVYFESGKAVLDEPAKKDLAKLADLACTLDGYLIEIAGHASSTGTREFNQKLSEERAAAVAQYLREKKTIPMRRIVAPAGYGATHPEASNADPEGRALNRRVDVIVLVNKGLNEGQ
jgi:outer membrane protein OmpA-like peptidoglycan-associated protein